MQEPKGGVCFEGKAFAATGSFTRVAFKGTVSPDAASIRLVITLRRAM